MRLYGYVKDQTTGLPVSPVYLDVRDEVRLLTNTTTNASGYYETSVPWSSLYTVGVSVWADQGGYTQLRYIPASKQVRAGDASAVRVDFDLRPGANLILYVYDTSGKWIRSADIWRLVRGAMCVTDLADVRNYGMAFSVHDANSVQDDPTWELAVPSFAIPVGSQNRVHLLWEVPGFGQIILDADNEGKGYTVATQGRGLVLNFNHEAAKSELASLRREFDTFRAGGYAISRAVVDGIESGADRLRAAEAHLTKTPPAMSQAVSELNLSLKATLWAQEQLHLEKARAETEQSRKGSVRLRVIDEKRQPIAGAKISFRQANRDFLLAVNPVGKAGKTGFEPQYAALLKQAGINYSYIIAGWEHVEPSPGQFQWSFLDNSQDVQAQLAYGFKLMGGLALWLFRGPAWAANSFCPAYLDGMTFPELQANARNHMRTLAARYRGRIDLWEFNEQNMDWTNCVNLTWDQKIELYRAAIAGMKEGNPDAKVIFDASALPYEFITAKLERTDVRAESMAFPEFLRLLGARDINYDAIGLEFYYSGVYQDGACPPSLSLTQISRLLDLYSRFGKPVFFREFLAPSEQRPGSTWWHRPWDEATQAEYLRSVYTIAFSKPLVQEIGWSYGLTDDGAAIASGGLLDVNAKPKASYYALKELAESWTTNGVGQTDANGEFLLRGFAGTYDVSVVLPNGAARQLQVRVGERRQEVAEIDNRGLPSVSGVVNAASFLPGPVAPGQIITLLGSGLGPDTPTALRLNLSGLLQNELGGTRVLFDGQSAPLLYVSARQIITVVPYAVADKTSTQMQVEYGGNKSAPTSLRVAAAAPGVFSVDSSGKGQGAVLNGDGTLNSPMNPAPRGSIVVLYATGEGQTSPPGVDGKIAASTLPKPRLPVSVLVGGTEAELLYAGAAPTLVAGVLQVNVRIPMDAVPGNAVPVLLVVGDFSSQFGVTIAVQ